MLALNFIQMSQQEHSQWQPCSNCQVLNRTLIGLKCMQHQVCLNCFNQNTCKHCDQLSSSDDSSLKEEPESQIVSEQKQEVKIQNIDMNHQNLQSKLISTQLVESLLDQEEKSEVDAYPNPSNNELEDQQMSQIEEESSIPKNVVNNMVGQQSDKLPKQCQQCSKLRQKNVALAQTVKAYQDNIQILQEKIVNLQGQLSLFKQKHQNFVESQAKSLVEREENQRKSAFLEKLTESYFKMLVIHFQSITSIISYGLALQKIKMVKLFINCFKDVTGNSQKLQDIIVQNEFGVQRYIAEDLNHFKAEIKRIQLNFETLQGDIGNKIKIILQKIKLYKEILGAAQQIEDFQNEISNKINQFLKNVVHKNINNNKTKQNQFIIIQYFNEFIKFYESFETEIKIIQQKCRQNLNQIWKNLRQNFKKIQGVYFGLELDQNEVVKPLYLNTPKIDIMTKLIITIRIILKNQKYRLYFERQTGKKITEFKDQINRSLADMRYTLKKKTGNKDIMNNYDKNYTYFVALSKIKDFDLIWEQQENFYYNFRFAELYEFVTKRNEILRNQKSHHIFRLIGQQKFHFQDLSNQITEIMQNQEISSIFVCRIKEIFAKKLIRLQRAIQHTSVDQEYLQKFKDFFNQTNELKKIIDKNKLGKFIVLQYYLNPIKQKANLLQNFLLHKFQFLHKNCKSMEFKLIEKQIKYLMNFEIFYQQQFKSMHQRLVKDIERKQVVLSDKIVFQHLQNIILQQKQYLQNFMNANILNEEGYDRIKKMRPLLTHQQEKQVNEKVQFDLQKRLADLQVQKWSKGVFDSQQEHALFMIIEKLELHLQFRYRQKFEKFQRNAHEEMGKIIAQVKEKLNVGQSESIKKELLEFISKIRTEFQNKTQYGKKFIKLLEQFLEKKLQLHSQTKMRQVFIQQYVYGLYLKAQSCKEIRRIFFKMEFKAYQRMAQQRLLSDILGHFKSEHITTKLLKMVDDYEQIISLYIFFQQTIGKSLLGQNETEMFKKIIKNDLDQMKKYLRNLRNSLNIDEHMSKKSFEAQCMSKVIKIKILQNLLNKFPIQANGENREIKKIIDKFQQKIRLFKIDILIRPTDEKCFNQNEIVEKEIVENLVQKDRKYKILSSIEKNCRENATFLKGKAINYMIEQIKQQDIMNTVRLNWKQFFEATIKFEANSLFSVDPSDSRKLKFFIKVKEIVNKHQIRLFDFMANEQYELNNTTIKDSQQIFHSTIENIQKLNNQYNRYFIEIGRKKKEVEKQRKEQKKKLEKESSQKINKLENIKQNQTDQEIIANIKAKINNIKQDKDEKYNQILQNGNDEIKNIQQNWNSTKKGYFSKIITSVRIIKKVSVEFPQNEVSKIIQNLIVDIFKDIESMNSTMKDDLIGQFYHRRQDCHYLANIVRKLKVFKDLKDEQFKILTQKQDIGYVINNCDQIKCRSQQFKAKLKQQYLAYQGELLRLQRQYTDKREACFKPMIQATIAEAANLYTPILLGKIFGIESIIRIQGRQTVQFRRKPHPVQMTAILLLLQSNSNGQANLASSFANGMVEVKTGEGKSVVLAGLCCFLALKGYMAYCACYSSYLSERDQKQFHELFKHLRVLDKIRYGTFADHCKQILDEKGKFCFKDVIQDFLLKNNQNIQTKYQLYLKRLNRVFEQKDNSKKILIIDEVDVFFDAKYFGKIYRPAFNFVANDIKEIIRFIWKNRLKYSKKELKLKTQQTPSYQSIMNKWPHLQAFFNNQLDGMIEAALNHKHSSEIQNNQIVYRYNGIIDPSINYGYATVFTACEEFEKGKISSSFYQNSLKMSLIVGEFSYAELPMYFNNIFGVSGTLKTLSKSKKDIMRKKYNIQNYYILPSAYKDCHRQFKTPIVISSEYQKNLVDNIKAVSDTGRPVLVFFKTRADMINLYNSPYLNQNLKQCFYVSEDEENLRDNRIQMAGKKGTVTLLTDQFSRGTDFLLEDKTLIEAGGIHVIQTYVSKDESDYVQVCGRTARQGKKGSYQMVIPRELLSNLDIANFDQNVIEGQIKAWWEREDKLYGALLNDDITQAKLIHDKSFYVIKSLSLGTTQLIKQIQRLNFMKFIAQKNVKTVIAIDCTKSMGKVLQKVKQKIKVVIKRTEQILKQANTNATSQQQFIIYRNYNSDPSQIIQCSGFSNDPQILSNWIEAVNVSGGKGNEAIELVYNRVRQMEGVDQLIIIGDARANTPENIKKKRDGKNPSQQYWESNDIPYVTSAEEELQALVQKKIPIHSLYIKTTSTNQGTEEYFTEISKKTNGTCQEFLVNEENASEKLANFIAKNILEKIGGQQLKKIYEQRHG